MINRLQIKKLVCYTSRDLIIFLIHYAHNRKNGGKSIIDCDIIKIQDSKYGATSQGLLYYCKEIPYIVLANVYTLLGIVNKAIVIVYRVVSHLNSMLNILR